MHDDPFARAVEKAQSAEAADKASKRARRQQQLSAGSRTALRIHVSVFVSVNLLLIAIWLTTWQLNDGTSYPWFIYPLLGWGIGLVAHAASTRNHWAGSGDQHGSTSSASVGDSAEHLSSTTEELSKLTDLHRAGALDDAEFSAAKAKLLR